MFGEINKLEEHKLDDLAEMAGRVNLMNTCPGRISPQNHNRKIIMKPIYDIVFMKMTLISSLYFRYRNDSRFLCLGLTIRDGTVPM